MPKANATKSKKAEKPAQPFKMGAFAWWVQPGDLEVADDVAKNPGVWLSEVIDVNDGVSVTLRKTANRADTNDPQEGAGAEKTFNINGTPYFDDHEDTAYAAMYDDTFPAGGMDNMTELRQLNQAELDRNLRLLHHHDKNYCYCGRTLVGINPFGKPKPGVYCDEKMEEYHGKTVEETEPHIYAVAETVFRFCFQNDDGSLGCPGGKQALVITGESGSGKTFTTKQALKYLAKVGAGEAKAGKLPVTTRIVKSNVVLDAFGNATMPRNDDSSRFGKLFQVFFDKGLQKVSGARITPYLLEKGRVAMQSHKERNFHVMYMLVDGVTDATKRTTLKLKDWQDYRYLNRFIPSQDAVGARASGTKYGSEHLEDNQNKLMHHTPDRDDVEEFNGLDEYLSEIGFDDDARMDIWRVVSAVLLCGEVEMKKTANGEGTEIVSTDVVGQIAELLYVSPESVTNAFTQVTRVVQGKPIASPLNLDKAVNAARTMATNLYNGLFVWLVETLSHELQEDAKPVTDACVGVLDIFGFEFTPLAQLDPPHLVNSFEQFCINLCNEKLQQHFVSCVMIAEQKCYKEELGQTITIDFEDNKANLKKIDEIMDSLNSITKRGRETDTDMDFHESLDKKYPIDKDKKKEGIVRMVDWKHGKGNEKNYHDRSGYGFVMKHYAANVLYDEVGWLDKNKGKLNGDITDCFVASAKSGTATAYPATWWTHQMGDGSASSTVAYDFNHALENLIHELKDSKCYFVRCIKSNRAKVGDLFEDALVLNQLQYTGMLDTLEIRRAGYPNRLSHTLFMDKFSLLYRDAGSDISALCTYLKTTEMVKQNGGADSLMLGKKLVLMRDEVFRALDAEQRKKLYASAVIAQAQYRAVAYRNSYQAKHKICTALKPIFKAAIARKKYRAEYNDKFEKLERVQIQVMINATVHRQRYYELKRKHEMVEKKLAELKDAHELSAKLHQKNVDGVAAKLDLAKMKLANEIKSVEAAQAQKVAQHTAVMKAISDENKKLQQTLEDKHNELEAQRQKASQTDENATTQKKNLEAAAVAADLAWKQRKVAEEKKLEALKGEPAKIMAENEDKIDTLKAKLEEQRAKNAEELENIRAKHESTIEAVHTAEEELKEIKEEGEHSEEQNKMNLAWLQNEMTTIDQRHSDEREHLKKQLASQNWKLAQLRLKEAQAEDQYNTLQRHGAMGVFGAAPQQAEVDILEAKIMQVEHSLNGKAEAFDRKMVMVKAAMQAEQDAAAAWDVAKQDHERQVLALKEAIARERDTSTQLDEQASHVAPQVNRRISRFSTRPSKYDDVVKPTEYILPAAPPPAPSDLPTSPAPAAAQSAYDRFGPYGASQSMVARADDPASGQATGELSTKQAATVSALFGGGLRSWPAQGMESMDPLTMQHALRLLR